MTDAIAAMLDELMGKHRNVNPDERPREPTWDDEEVIIGDTSISSICPSSSPTAQKVCKHYLVGFCPYDLFTNTKSDLGTCDKLHADRLKEQYQQSGKVGKMGYEQDFLAFLQKLHNDMQRKIQKHNQRLEMTGPVTSMAALEKQKLEEKIQQLNARINQMAQEAEGLGEQGLVDDAQKVANSMAQVVQERDNTQMIMEGKNPEEQQLEVCETCGCFLIVGDAQQRIDEHMVGKQHLGYAKIKATIDELILRFEELRKARDRDRRSPDRDKDRSSHGSRREDRDRDKRDSRDGRDRDRHVRSHERRSSKDRDRDRDRRRSRSRDRDRNRRSSKDRGEKDRRDRDKRRSRSRDRDRDRNRRRSDDRSSSHHHHKSESRDERKSTSATKEGTAHPIVPTETSHDRASSAGGLGPDEARQADVGKHNVPTDGGTRNHESTNLAAPSGGDDMEDGMVASPEGEKTADGSSE